MGNGRFKRGRGSSSEASTRDERTRNNGSSEVVTEPHLSPCSSQMASIGHHIWAKGPQLLRPRNEDRLEIWGNKMGGTLLNHTAQRCREARQWGEEDGSDRIFRALRRVANTQTMSLAEDAHTNACIWVLQCSPNCLILGIIQNES